MSRAIAVYTPSPPPLTAIPVIADVLLTELAAAFRIADAASEQCFADAEAQGEEGKRMHALACQHAHSAEDLAEAICAARADGLTGAAIQSDALSYIGLACWTDERHELSRASADASIRRVLAMAVERISAPVA